jgi:acyl-CoA dehydrogenase family protein 9
MKALFCGRLDAELVFPYPRSTPEERETLALVLGTFRDWARDNLDGAAIDRTGAFPGRQVRELAEMGFLGMTIPEEYGGSGLALGSYCRLMEEICRHCASTATIVGAHLGIGSKGIVLYGSEEQKRRFLPEVAKGAMLAAYALTEPGSGSDAASLVTRAVWDAKRRVYVLNGTKRFITNGGHAGLFTVFARHVVEGKDRISAFIVTRDLPGVASGREEEKLGLKGSSTTDVTFQDTPVPEANLLGEPGRGFKYAMEILNDGRVSLAAGSVGVAKEMIDRAVAYAKERRQFGPREAARRRRLDRVGPVQDRGLGELLARGQSRGADRRRQRLHPRVPVRTLPARLPDQHDLRRDQRDPAGVRRARRPAAGGRGPQEGGARPA